jgi:hypothetical protein
VALPERTAYVAFRIRPEFPAQRSGAVQFRWLLHWKMTALLRKIGRFEPENRSRTGLRPSDARPSPSRGARRR